MSVYVTAEFRQLAAAAAAIRGLRESGWGPADLDLFSEEPVLLPRGLLDRPSHMSLVSVLGAIALGSAATGFVYYSQHDYALVTGGMPIFSFWATGVITYEMTMLGAMVATFAWFLWESGLLRKRDKSVPVPLVDPGAMRLRVRCDASQAARAGEIMSGAGAIQIERREA
jgi:hypothetical protein